MSKKVDTLMIEFLKENVDMFAWSPSDFKGIDAEIIVHRLNVDPMVRPVKQKKRSFGAERNKIIEEEVRKLSKAGYVSEVQYTDWLANVVVVPKASRKWRMCTDFKDLNKACPKDPYPLPRIDLLVDSTTGYELFSMMDAYQGYHQIFMAEEDRIKTSFITDQGIYCYNVMPFGLKNAGATYQRLVNRMFKNQIGSTMEVYVDDMLVKSTEGDHLKELRRAFEIMRAYGMKLNPSKCTFGVRGGKFLGYMVSEKGIEANPEKIQAIMGLRSPRTLNEMQKLTEEAVSSMLVREQEKNQNPVYYVSKMLQGAEKRYTQIEKLALALVITARKLRPYFQSHKVVVLTNHTLKHIMMRPDAPGRLVKWAIELGEYDIEYQGRNAIKAQALANFIVEFTEEQAQEEKGGWLLHVDGSSNASNGGAGVLLQGPDGVEIEVAARLSFSATNNEAEYEALVLGLQLASEAGIKELNVCTDSQLVAMQVERNYETRERTMVQYLGKVKELMARFDKCTVQQIPRSENERADALSKFGAMVAGVKERKITLIIKEHPIIEEKEEVQMIESSSSWKADFMNYLKDGTLPDDLIKAKRIKFKATRFTVVENDLYKRTIDGPLLKCLDEERAQYVLREIHKGSCGNHSGGRSLAQKVIRQGYFWPTLVKNAMEFARKCESCQRFASLIHTPATPMEPVRIACPFDQWGIDILGPFPLAVAQKKFIVVVVEYFTKWVEAEALAKITEKEMINFIWKNIICRFDIPRIMISDNEGAKGYWVEELPGVLWAYGTTPRSSTGETPFCLVYGTEAIIPAEIGEETQRVAQYEIKRNKEERAFDLTMIEEKREAAYAKILHHKGLMMRSYNRRIKPRCFQVGDLVLKKVEVSKHMGKLDPGWEGPFKVIKIKKPGTYKLQDMEGKDLPRPWNVHNLKRFYA
ncbi:UNVERIFIED_CONTAM: Retrovirus-related Pol polyprotein from transposon gypsy [Sesamum latifolium]|uniref:Retrovirus-related Pol polyprotein from transposon gypsy n=1 Tax=Sesamum latifolium TaxID=2727402 RepID=A0AAW2XFG3_9LAMI